MQQPAPQASVVLTAKEAAAFLKLSYFTIQQLASEGRIPARKLGRQWRFLQSELTGFLLVDYKAIRRSDNEHKGLAGVAPSAPVHREFRRKKDDGEFSSFMGAVLARIKAKA
jgi:excisionase family DNA binding protein